MKVEEAEEEEAEAAGVVRVVESNRGVVRTYSDQPPHPGHT